MAVMLIGSMTIACGPSVGDDDGAADSAGGSTAVADSSGSGSLSDTGVDPMTSSTGSDDMEMTSTTAVDSDDATDDSMEGGGFIYGPSDAGPRGPECDLVAQDCPVDEKCMPWANDGGSVWNSTRCSPLERDPIADGEACLVEGNGVSGIDDCGLGSMCFFVDPADNTGECRALCVDGGACDGPDMACGVVVPAFVELCLDTCDPELAECPEGQTCTMLDAVSVCAPE